MERMMENTNEVKCEKCGATFPYLGPHYVKDTTLMCANCFGAILIPGTESVEGSECVCNKPCAAVAREIAELSERVAALERRGDGQSQTENIPLEGSAEPVDMVDLILNARDAKDVR
jgi:hypothetical protein